MVGGTAAQLNAALGCRCLPLLAAAFVFVQCSPVRCSAVMMTMHACMHVCMYVCLYVCMHACMYDAGILVMQVQRGALQMQDRRSNALRVRVERAVQYMRGDAPKRSYEAFSLVCPQGVSAACMCETRVACGSSPRWNGRAAVLQRATAATATALHRMHGVPDAQAAQVTNGETPGCHMRCHARTEALGRPRPHPREIWDRDRGGNAVGPAEPFTEHRPDPSAARAGVACMRHAWRHQHVLHSGGDGAHRKRTPRTRSLRGLGRHWSHTHARARASRLAVAFIESPRARCTTSSVPGPDDRQRPRWQCRRTRRQPLDVLPARGPGCMHAGLHACGARAAATAPRVCSRIGNQCSGVDGRIRKDPPACRPMRFWTCPIGDSTARHGCYRLWMIQHQCLWYKQKLC